jgi:tetratricopeptide (TPR) repeat protein
VLFDLRSGGRRRFVKVVYVTLAILMGGGLVLFGIGGEVSGGLVDAITESDGGGDPSDRFQQREDQALAAARANPRDEAAWIALTRARVQLAGQGDNIDPATGEYSRAGQAELRQAAQAWERYLALDPDPPDSRTARLMVQGYAALGDLGKAARAQEIVAEDRPTAPTYTQLAALYYQAGNTRLGDLARREALRRTPRDEREALRGQLDQARAQAQAGGAQAPGS